MAAYSTNDFQTIIGLEVHAQVLTRSKMYCGCSADYANAEPNSHVCPVCLGLPGALPVINRAAIEMVLRTGLALGCTVPVDCKLDRKNYVYPDLPKGYQISQYDLPLCLDGMLDFDVNGTTRRAGITRVHIEEDTGRLMHDTVAGERVSLVDLNRSGVPLMEIVGEPDLRSPDEAREYLVALRRILRYLGASTGNMEEGAFRCDANISIRAHDGGYIGPKIEIKNMNSFRSVERALRFEESRQRAEIVEGGVLVQETRGWTDSADRTVSQRTKEQAHDYRYFPEPDLPPVQTTETSLESIRSNLPEMPHMRLRRFIEEFGLAPADAAVLTNERSIADTFESAACSLSNVAEFRAASNWIVNDVMGLARVRGLPADVLPLSSLQIGELVQLVRSGSLTGRAAKELLPQLASDERLLDAAKRLDLLSVDDDNVVATAVADAIAANPDVVADYLGGKKAALGRLIGESMKRTNGRARPDAVRAALASNLDAKER